MGIEPNETPLSHLEPVIWEWFKHIPNSKWLETRCDERAALGSIAISLKRMADMMENIAPQNIEAMINSMCNNISSSIHSMTVRK